MFLSFFDKLRQMIVELIDSINVSSVITLISGIVIGFVLCFVIYLCLVLSAFKKEGEIKEENDIEIEDETILKMIKSSKNQYIEESSSLTTTQKLDLVKTISLRLVNDIAKMYYPESDYPIYELNVDELLMLCHYITDRINSIFKGPIMKHLKKLKVSQVVKLIDFKKKIDENKVLKAANKAKVPKLLSGVGAVLNVVNPVYWVRKVMINTTTLVLTKKVALTIFDVIGVETTKVYSKSVFNKENNLEIEVDKSINEIESLMEGEK